MANSDELAQELIRIVSAQEFNLRQTTQRQLTALGERPYAEPRSRSSSVSSISRCNTKTRRFLIQGLLIVIQSQSIAL